MVAATTEQVRRAITSSNATGTAAEVLSTISTATIQKTDSTRRVYSDVVVLLNSLGLNGNAIVDDIRADLLANGPKWVCDQLGGSGIDFAHSDLQNQLDSLVSASRITPQLAAILKGLGVWMESPLEDIAGRGATTNEETVQLVLDQIAEEVEQIEYDYKIMHFSALIQPNGKINLSCRVAKSTLDNKQGDVIVSIATADAVNAELPNKIKLVITSLLEYINTL